MVNEEGIETGKDELHFFYDSNSKPAFVEYNGVKYRYLHNLQGDIIGIVDSNGTLVVEYKYDAWGKPVSTTGSLAGTLGTLNPFRYRGYMYDAETGLCYLRSRYYSPELHRFINADKLINTNLYFYCENASINRIDSSGLSSICAEAVNTTDVTIYIFTGKQYGHYTVGAMGMVFSWESANNGSLAIYSEDTLEEEMVKAGFDSTYFTITVPLPTDAVSNAIKKVYEHCRISYVDSEFPFAQENHLNKRYAFYDDREKKTYNPFDYSCFAFVDWFFHKAGVNLEKIIGGSITKNATEKKRKQYLFAQEFLEKYPQYRKTNSRIGY